MRSLCINNIKRKANGVSCVSDKVARNLICISKYLSWRKRVRNLDWMCLRRDVKNVSNWAQSLQSKAKSEWTSGQKEDLLKLSEVKKCILCMFVISARMRTDRVHFSHEHLKPSVSEASVQHHKISCLPLNSQPNISLETLRKSFSRGRMKTEIMSDSEVASSNLQHVNLITHVNVNNL